MAQWEHPSPEQGRRCLGSLPGVQGSHGLRILHQALEAEEQEPRGFMLLLREILTGPREPRMRGMRWRRQKEKRWLWQHLYKLNMLHVDQFSALKSWFISVNETTHHYYPLAPFIPAVYIRCIFSCSTNLFKLLKLSHHLKRKVSAISLNHGVILISFLAALSKSCFSSFCVT